MKRQALWLGILVAGCAGSATPDEVALERYYEANHLFSERQYTRAAEHYEFVIAVRDRLKDAYHKLAYCYEVRGREGDAVGVLERLLRVDRQDEVALWNLGRLYTHRGLISDAIQAYKVLEGRFSEVRGEIARLEKVKSAAGTQ